MFASRAALTWPMGNLYLFLLCLASEVDQMMKPEMTSKTASRVVTIMERDPLTAAMLTRTSKSTLRTHYTDFHQCDQHWSWKLQGIFMEIGICAMQLASTKSSRCGDADTASTEGLRAWQRSCWVWGRLTCWKGKKEPQLSWPCALLPHPLHPRCTRQNAMCPPAGKCPTISHYSVMQKPSHGLQTLSLRMSQLGRRRVCAAACLIGSFSSLGYALACNVDILI